MQNYAFWAKAQGPAGDTSIKGFFADAGDVVGGFTETHGTQAGFSTISIPEISEDGVEYREGHHVWTKKQPMGVPTVSDSTFQRGIALESTGFLRWAMAKLSGAEYRADITVFHWQRKDRVKNAGQANGDQAKARQYIFHEAFPTRVKPAGDLDATAGDVSLAEMDVAMEWSETVTPGGQKV